MQPCWVCKWLEWDEDWLINIENVDATPIVKPDFYRLIGDRYVQYGDGGDSFLVYPVWIQEYLPVSEKLREHLLETLQELNEQRHDHHAAPSPVEDIIDPDLLAFRPPSFERTKWIEHRRRQLEPCERALRYFKRDLTDGEYDHLSEHEQLRDTYQWLPSEFIVQTDGKVDIRKPILHLPVIPKYRRTYGAIAQIFHAMLPMFQEIKVIAKDTTKEQRLQVIVKAQSYNIKAGMKYSGRWHTEGQTENIVAVGVYYLHVDPELEGGALKFRPKKGPQDWYEGINIDFEVTSIRTGTAIVFSNSMPHRFRQIRNLTPDDGRRRTFLNFFIVDPDQPINLQLSELVLAPMDTIVSILQQWNQGQIPDLVLDRIVRILQVLSPWQTQDEVKMFRSRVRKAMLEEKSGWGWICWGNCGTTEFVRALCAWSPRERQEAREELRHTESDS
ncbi:unnamed protein product [Rotaria sp. Silwood1]|nr:unnamed protein product [Rotaria sp. Silwood1]